MVLIYIQVPTKKQPICYILLLRTIRFQTVINALQLVYFLDKNNKLYHTNGSKIIADNTLVAITILIAESKTEEKEMMIKLIVNLMVAN